MYSVCIHTCVCDCLNIYFSVLFIYIFFAILVKNIIYEACVVHNVSVSEPHEVGLLQ